jgi:uncharacterized protein
MAVYILEIIVVLLVFLLPAFLPVSADQGMNTGFFLSYLLISVPQIFLLWYYLKTRDPGLLPAFGLRRIQSMDALWGLLCVPAVFAIYFFIAVVLGAVLPKEAGEWFSQGYRWKLSNPLALPSALAFCLATGYREEMLFRSYLFVRCTQTGLPVPVTIAVNSLLFASLHLYEGPVGFIFAFVIGVFFAAVFLRFRTIHIPGIGHGLFNFAALVISMLVP